MIISVVAAKIWFLKNVRFLLGHPVYAYDVYMLQNVICLHRHVLLFVAMARQGLARPSQWKENERMIRQSLGKMIL